MHPSCNCLLILDPPWLAPVELGKRRLPLRNPPVWNRGYTIRIWYNYINKGQENPIWQNSLGLIVTNPLFGDLAPV
jgi:hypothetical protein